MQQLAKFDGMLFSPLRQALNVSRHYMSRLFLSTFILASFMSGSVYSQTFDALTSRIFFDANLKSKDTALLSYFQAKDGLTPKKDTGWTMYPPTNEKGEPLPYYRFTFAKHPYFQQTFQGGGMEVITSVQKDKVVGMTLGFHFGSKAAFTQVYNNIMSLYKKYASRVVKREVAEPFEVTKFIAKNKHDFVIITKGESIEDDNKPYIHIAFNFQDYVW